MARIILRVSSSCAKGDAYATVSLASVWSAGRDRVGPGAGDARRRADLVDRRDGRDVAKHPDAASRADKTPSARPGRAAGGARPGGRRLEKSVHAPLEHVPAWGAASAATPATRRAGSVIRTFAMACCSPRDACCMKPPTGTAPWAPTTSAGATRAFSAPTSGSACSKSTACGMRSRSSTASTRHRFHRSRRWRAVAGRQRATSGEPQRVPLDLAAIRPARAPRHRHVSRQRHTDDSLDVTGGFTTTKHSGELPWGASFGFSNDNEVALPYRSRTNDMDVGLEWTNNRAMFRAAYNGSWFDNQADTLTWDNPLVPDGFDVGLGARPDGLVAVQLVADPQRCWLREVCAADAAHRLARLRLGEQRRATATVHHQQRAATIPVAPGHHRRLGADDCHHDQPGLAPGERMAVQHAVPPVRLQQRHARDRDSRVHQLRHLGQDQHDRRSGALRARPQHVRCRCHVDPLQSAGPHRRVHEQSQRI